MDKNPLLKYMMDDEKREDFFHTSRHARLQSGANMGAASTETFAQRRVIDQNRTRVKKYSDSRIVAQSRARYENPKVYTPPEQNFGLRRGGADAGGTSGVGHASTSGGTAGTSGGARPPMPRR